MSVILLWILTILIFIVHLYWCYCCVAGLGYMPKCTLPYDPCCLSVWNYWYLFLLPSLLADCHKVCSLLQAAFQIKAGAFTGATQTDVYVPQDFDVILAVALLITNAVATLLILHKAWYYICLSVAYKSWLQSGCITYKWMFSRNKESLPRLNKSCLFL